MKYDNLLFAASLVTIMALIYLALAQVAAENPSISGSSEASFRIEIVCEETPQPEIVRLLSGGIVLRGEGEEPNKSPYHINISSFGEDPFFSGTIEAKWGEDVNANLRVQIPASSQLSKTSLFFFKPDIEPTMESIDRIRSRDLSGTNAFRTYFEAKSIYKRVFPHHPDHDVTFLAAHYWHEAAVALSENPNSVIQMDKEARAALQRVARLMGDDNKSDAIRNALNSHGIRESYITGMIERSGALEWRFAANIAEAAKIGAIKQADRLNSYFMQQWEIADAEERDAIVSYYKVNGEWLSQNGSYFQELQKIKGDSW